MIRFILSTLSIVAILVAAILLEGGNPFSYVAFSAMIIVIFVPFFAVLAVWRLSEWGKAWKDAFSAQRDSTTSAVSVAIWEFSEKASYAAGIIGLIVGIILVLSNVSDFSKMGRGLAATLTAPMWSILIGLVSRILGAKVVRNNG
jgi:flagellar motor component MotA